MIFIRLSQIHIFLSKLNAKISEGIQVVLIGLDYIICTVELFSKKEKKGPAKSQFSIQYFVSDRDRLTTSGC